MQNRKDLLQAHRLMTQRAALALLQAEPDPADRPLRRLNVGMFSGILVAVLLTAAFGIWGLLAPGNAQGLDAPGTLIIDGQSATSYIWCQGGAKLCPAVNYASARLALGTDTPDVRTVSQASLASYPRGPLIGIPGLPQPLPDSSMLVGAPWSVCVQAVTNPATLQRHTVTTLVGGHNVGGRVVPAGRALLVQAAGSDWLIWDGQRLLVPGNVQRNILTALDTTQQPETMPSAWLNAFPRGTDFAPPAVSGFGQPARGPTGGPARVGQVFTTTAVPGASRQSYVMLSGGLAPITQTQAALLNAAPHQVAPASVDPSAVASDLSKTGVPASGLPARMPSVTGYAATSPLCVVYQSSATVAPSGPQVTVGGTVPSYALATNGSGGVSQVALPPGTAALLGVVASSQPGAAGAGQAPQVSGYYLLAGGLRYGLASPGVAGVLGYTLQRQQTLVPASVADLIPQGPAFDPGKARQQVAP